MSSHSALLASLGPDARDVVVVDLDRTVACGAHREHLLGDGTAAEWDAFFNACGGDAPIEEIIAAVRHDLGTRQARGEKVFLLFLTGRPERVRDLTAVWLEDQIVWASGYQSWLMMRGDDDRRKAEVFKAEVLRAILDAGHRVAAVYDDERKTIDACVELGIRAHYVIRRKDRDRRELVPSDVFARLEDAVALKREFVADNAIALEDVAQVLLKQVAYGDGKVMACGNGGSASDASHFVGELVGRFKAPGREPLPAMVLASDPATMTAIANDFGYDHVYERVVAAFCGDGDVLFCFSTSGMSPNIVAAASKARKSGAIIVSFVGRRGSELESVSDYEFVVARGPDSARIQECHIFGVHLLCERLEQLMGCLDDHPGSALTSRGSR